MDLRNVLNWACWAIIAWSIIEPAISGPLHRPASEARFGDHAINESLSRHIDSERSYPKGFLYPPPSVAIRVWLYRFAGDASGWFWVGMLVLATLASFPLMYRLLGIADQPLRHVVGLIGFLAARYYIGYDLLACNGNGITLFLTLAAVCALCDGRSMRAGALLATAIALKIYALALLPLWLLRGRIAALVAACCGIAIWFVAVPLCTWEANDAVLIFNAWRLEATAASTLEFQQDFVAYVVTLEKALTSHLGQTAETSAIGNGLLFVWCLGIGAYFARFRMQAGDVDVADFCDANVALLAPLPLSPILQPHHLVLLLPGQLVIANFICSTSSSERSRRLEKWCCILAMALPIAALHWGPGNAGRGFAVFFHLVATIVGLALVRRAITKNAGVLAATIERTALLPSA